jgi:CheY-like chemotaxis protein
MMSGVTRVLVADDVRDSADTLAALLGTSGFDARAVYDGRDAVTVAGMWHPDGALLDLSLPGLSGYEVAREFRRMYGQKIRLVAYTGWGSSSDRDRCIEAGFDGFLVKPADPEQLLRVMGQARAELVRKSMDNGVRQLRRQIDLGRSLLEHCDLARPERAEQIRAFLERALAACRDGLPAIAANADERRELEGGLADLERRIAASRSPPR